MGAVKKSSPAVRPGCTQMLASNVFIKSTHGSTAHQLTAVLTVAPRIHQVVGVAE